MYFPEFPFLGIWTQQNAPFICLEPWLGIADSQNTNQQIIDKEGIQILKPDQQKEVDLKIEFY